VRSRESTPSMHSLMQIHSCAAVSPTPGQLRYPTCRDVLWTCVHYIHTVLLGANGVRHSHDVQGGLDLSAWAAAAAGLSEEQKTHDRRHQRSSVRKHRQQWCSRSREPSRMITNCRNAKNTADGNLLYILRHDSRPFNMPSEGSHDLDADRAGGGCLACAVSCIGQTTNTSPKPRTCCHRQQCSHSH
jgi:hypothetical protein